MYNQARSWVRPLWRGLRVRFLLRQIREDWRYPGHIWHYWRNQWCRVEKFNPMITDCVCCCWRCPDRVKDRHWMHEEKVAARVKRRADARRGLGKDRRGAGEKGG